MILISSTRQETILPPRWLRSAKISWHFSICGYSIHETHKWESYNQLLWYIFHCLYLIPMLLYETFGPEQRHAPHTLYCLHTLFTFFLNFLNCYLFSPFYSCNKYNFYRLSCKVLRSLPHSKIFLVILCCVIFFCFWTIHGLMMAK
jgi:hypothetical protein